MKSKALTVVMTVIAVVATVMLVVTVIKLVTLDSAVDTNRERIKELERPCTEADLRHPERSEGCEP